MIIFDLGLRQRTRLRGLVRLQGGIRPPEGSAVVSCPVCDGSRHRTARRRPRYGSPTRRAKAPAPAPVTAGRSEAIAGLPAGIARQVARDRAQHRGRGRTVPGRGPQDPLRRSAAARPSAARHRARKPKRWRGRHRFRAAAADPHARFALNAGQPVSARSPPRQSRRFSRSTTSAIIRPLLLRAVSSVGRAADF